MSLELEKMRLCAYTILELRAYSRNCVVYQWMFATLPNTAAAVLTLCFECSFCSSDIAAR